MGSSGHISLPMMACGLFGSFHIKENSAPQNGKNSYSEFTFVRLLYRKLVTIGDVVGLMDLFRSLTPDERIVFCGKEGRVKSLKMFISKHCNIFQLSRDSGKGREVVRPVIGIEFCKVFDSKQGCDNRLCPKLHVCRHFVKGKCTFGSKCKKPHQFDDPHTLSILKRHYLDGLDHSHLKEFLCRNVQFALDDSVDEASLPKQLEICKYYNVAIGCSREGQCPFLHVCRFYAEDGTCKFGQKCIRKHDCRSDHARLLLRRYNIGEADVFSYLRKPRKQSRQDLFPLDTYPDFERPNEIFRSPKCRVRTMSVDSYDATVVNRDRITPRKASEPSNLYQLGNTYICMRYLEGQCKSQSCGRIHALMPYSWQYTVDNRNWKEVGNEENLKIETMFVDPYQDDVIINIEDKQRFIISFNNWIGILTLPSLLPLQEPPSVAMSIRRASTPPSVTVLGENSEFSTQWVWYYLDECKTWQEYDDMHNIGNEKLSTVDSQRIEIAYQNIGQESLVFNCDGVAFVIDFKNMTQENTKTRQCTQVKRRPKVFDFDKLFKRNKDDTQLEISYFPCYWKIDGLQGISGGDFGQCELLKLEPYSREYLRVFHDFERTMRCEDVLKIEAVQNVGLWMAYTMERDTLKEESYEKAEEISLYCAVSWEHAREICRCGFENDMVSAERGFYYFAKDAYLANKYTKPNDSGFFVTFHCRVLANSCSMVTKPEPYFDNFYHSGRNHLTCHKNGPQNSNQAVYHVTDGRHIYPEFVILSRHERKVFSQSAILPCK